MPHSTSQLGELHEVWVEGEATTCIDIITPYRILMLSGTKGNIARWRHWRRPIASTTGHNPRIVGDHRV